jgi:HEAT repeat protein
VGRCSFPPPGMSNPEVIVSRSLKGELKEIVEVLIVGFNSDDPTVRRVVAKFVGDIGPDAKAAVPALAAALKDEYRDVREAAAGSLVQMGPGAVAALTEALKDDYWLVRRTAAEALGNIGPGAMAAVPALTEALKDEVCNVRGEAAEALKRIRRE